MSTSGIGNTSNAVKRGDFLSIDKSLVGSSSGKDYKGLYKVSNVTVSRSFQRTAQKRSEYIYHLSLKRLGKVENVRVVIPASILKSHASISSTFRVSLTHNRVNYNVDQHFTPDFLAEFNFLVERAVKHSSMPALKKEAILEEIKNPPLYKGQKPKIIAYFRTIAVNVLKSTGVDEDFLGEDLLGEALRDALANAISASNFDGWPGKDNTPVYKWVGNVYKGRLKDELAKILVYKDRQQTLQVDSHEPDGSHSDQFDKHVNDHSPGKQEKYDPEEAIGYNSLVSDVLKFVKDGLSKSKAKDKELVAFKLYLQGYQAADIIKIMNDGLTDSEEDRKKAIGKSTLTKYMDKFISLMFDYADQEDNDLFLSILVSRVKEGQVPAEHKKLYHEQKRIRDHHRVKDYDEEREYNDHHSYLIDTANDFDIFLLRDIFRDYKKSASLKSTDHAAIGVVKTIQVSKIDAISDATLRTLALSDEVSSDEIVDKRVEEFEFLDVNPDVIEDLVNGKLVGLRVID